MPYFLPMMVRAPRAVDLVAGALALGALVAVAPAPAHAMPAPTAVVPGPGNLLQPVQYYGERRYYGRPRYYEPVFTTPVPVCLQPGVCRLFAAGPER